MTRTQYDRHLAKHRAKYRPRHARPSRWTRLTCAWDLLMVRVFAAADARVALAARGLA
jgi:hypothetical protein